MKHKFLQLAVFALLTVFSCTEEETFQENRITRVSAELPDFLEEDGTRSQINVSASDGVSYTWAIGDVLGVFPDDGMQSYFRLTESSLSADGKKATFDGGAWTLKNAHTYYSYFPFSYENSREISTFSVIPVDYTGQSITEWGDTKNAGKYDFNAAGGTTPISGALSFKFQRLGALLRLKFALPVTGTYKKLTLSTDADVIPIKGKVDLSASPLVYTPETYASSISLNLNNISGTEGQEVFVYMMLPPMALNTQGKTLVVTLSHDKGSSNYLIYKAGESVSVTPDFNADFIYKRVTSPQTVEADGGLSSYGYVDLGLSSGLLWATCNVGASSPEEDGDYYAWGETETKSNYDYSTYKWCNGSSSTFTKYCSNSSYGTVDNKTVLELSDDVAHEKWGGTWRIPTFAEWDELRTSCTWIWAYQNGKNGYIVTGPNGKFIFLPAAGYYNGSSLDGLGSIAGYWSSTLYSDANYPYLAYDQAFNNLTIWNDASSSREFGRSVRPVLSSSSLFEGMVTGITFDNPSLSLKAGETKTLSVTTNPDATNPSVAWSSSNPSVATVTSSGVVTAVSDGTALITATSTDGGGVKASCAVTVKVPTLSNGHECVDMGLPSGTQWADRNVGASLPEDYGNFYGWGETEADIQKKTAYEWAYYGLADGYDDELKKYCTVNSFGYYDTADNKTVLEPLDDAAREMWGGYWRMPTITELRELIDNCTWTWTTRNGKNGYLVTGSNGNSIFLPAAGYYSGTTLNSVGSAGYYWSSSLNTDRPKEAFGLVFASSVDWGSYDRYFGHSVRPVISTNDLENKVMITGITLNKTTLSLPEGGSFTLSATVAPSNATNKSLTWWSPNTSVATVSESGVVTAVEVGTVYIYADAKDGSGKRASCVVTVTEPVKVTGITLNQTSLSLTQGDLSALSAIVAPSDASDKTVTWMTSNSDVATVYSSGEVYAAGIGTATITAIANDGSGKTATCTVTVEAPPVKVTEITLNQTSLTLKEDDSYTLSATVAPDDATDKKVIWSSTNPDVAKVNASGVVTAVKAGTANIKAIANDGSGVNAVCSVTVTSNASGVLNGHEYVDLGLSVKWATCNVGASSPEAYGNFYAWGETETKSSYNWSNNRWGISENSLTKYCTDSNKGLRDNKKVLEPSDDVAQVKWGGSWRMPTDTEMTELRENCTWTWTTYGGKNGYKVTSKSNGKAIFLPAAGIRTGNAYQFADGDGYYWSSSLDTSDPGSARHLQFAFNYFYMTQSSRALGFPVRPVCP